MTSIPASGSFAAFWIEFAPASMETNTASDPKIARSDCDVSELAGLALFTTIATFGASFICVVAGFVTPTFRSNHIPFAWPAASSADFVAGSFGKMSVPAGMSPPVVEVKLASAISPVTPLRRSASAARTSVGPWRVTE